MQTPFQIKNGHGTHPSNRCLVFTKHQSCGAICDNAKQPKCQIAHNLGSIKLLRFNLLHKWKLTNRQFMLWTWLPGALTVLGKMLYVPLRCFHKIMHQVSEQLDAEVYLNIFNIY